MGQRETTCPGTLELLVRYLRKQNQRQQVISAELFVFQQHTGNPCMHLSLQFSSLIWTVGLTSAVPRCTHAKGSRQRHRRGVFLCRARWRRGGFPSGLHHVIIHLSHDLQNRKERLPLQQTPDMNQQTAESHRGPNTGAEHVQAGCGQEQ